VVTAPFVMTFDGRHGPVAERRHHVRPASADRWPGVAPGCPGSDDVLAHGGHGWPTQAPWVTARPAAWLAWRASHAVCAVHCDWYGNSLYARSRIASRSRYATGASVTLRAFSLVRTGRSAYYVTPSLAEMSTSMRVVAPL